MVTKEEAVELKTCKLCGRSVYVLDKCKKCGREVCNLCEVKLHITHYGPKVYHARVRRMCQVCAKPLLDDLGVELDAREREKPKEKK